MSNLQQVHSRILDKLYRQHRSMCLRAAYRVTTNREMAEDAVQHMFTRLRPGHIEPVPEEKVPSYLARAAANAARDQLRMKERLRESPLTSANRRVVIDHCSNPEEFADAAERRNLVRALIEQLPERCQEVVRLTVYEGLTHREAGERLSVSVKAVERQITRALVHMRKMPEAQCLLEAEQVPSIQDVG